MANFVLIAGARLGSWAWDDVVPHLRAAGHGVHPLTLSGLAERQGVPTGEQTHVQDVVDEVERQDMREVILVGHSYSGVPSGQAAGRIGDRLAHVVFLDSSVPADGEPFVSAWPDSGARVRASIAENGGFWPVAPAAHFEGHGLTDEQIARIVGGATPCSRPTGRRPGRPPAPVPRISSARTPGRSWVIAGRSPSAMAPSARAGRRLPARPTTSPHRTGATSLISGPVSYRAKIPSTSQTGKVHV
ncbi:alpha/beta fold hydrolase [Streptomyces sp. DT190]|uniref:alpha/beta hydrolase n=1 Tax=unclassified Streptomyces TaxID=2593676 RepID=UPI003CED47E5